MPTKADAKSLTVDIEYAGETYSVPAAEDWDIDVLEAIDAQRATVALRSLLGDEQYKEFRARHTKVRELNEFFALATEAVAAGNS